MKRLMLAVALVGALFVGCDGVDTKTTEQAFDVSKIRIVTVDWRGQKCDLAYIYISSGIGDQSTGGPAMANLGCYAR